MMQLKIGSLVFPSVLIQAPLAGYSCAPMRRLVQQSGGAAYACTEMLSAQHIFSGAKQKKRFEYKDPDEDLLCYQLSGNKADVLARASEQVCLWGADLIDLNCGCPQPKIRKKKVGSSLLADPEHLYRLVCAMKSAVSVPVTVKIRVDGSSQDNNNISVADAVASAGADALIVHGRHWSERYDTQVSAQQIKLFVDAVDIPVIANGDVECAASAKELLGQTGAAGIMIARASLGQPWLFSKIKSELLGQAFKMPSLSEVGAMLIQHAQGLIDLEGEVVALLQSRKLLKYYMLHADLDYSMIDLSQVNCFNDLEKIVALYFE
jgi:tRNA-dihydrouridine synthase B